MSGQAGEPEDVRQALDRLADLMLFRERFSQDPRGALEMYGLSAVPTEAVDALAALSPEELRVFSEVQAKLSEVDFGEEVGIFF